MCGYVSSVPSTNTGPSRGQRPRRGSSYQARFRSWTEGYRDEDQGAVRRDSAGAGQKCRSLGRVSPEETLGLWQEHLRWRKDTGYTCILFDSHAHLSPLGLLSVIWKWRPDFLSLEIFWSGEAQKTRNSGAEDKFRADFSFTSLMTLGKWPSTMTLRFFICKVGLINFL